MKNKKLLTGILLGVLLVVITGISFALYFSDQSSSDNAINTGQVSFTYTEPSNTVVLNNALPQEDNTGKTQTNYFDFSVTSNATTNEDDDNGVEVPYEISLSPVTIDNLLSPLNNDDIKVYLTRLDGEVETEVLAPTKISELSQAQYRTNAFKLLKEIDSFHNNMPSKTTKYRLRFWIADSVDASNWNENGKYQYKFVVNVNAKANKADNSNKLSSHIKSLYTVENNAMVVADDGTSYIKGEYEESSSGSEYSPADGYLSFFWYLAGIYTYQNEDGSFDEEKLESDIKNYFVNIEEMPEAAYQEQTSLANGYLNMVKGMVSGIIDSKNMTFIDGKTIDDIPTLEEILNNDTTAATFMDFFGYELVSLRNINNFNDKYKKGNSYDIEIIESDLNKGAEIHIIHGDMTSEEIISLKENFGSINNYIIAEMFGYIDYDEDDNLILSEDITIEDLPKLEDFLIAPEEPIYIQNNFIKINDMLWQIYGVNSDGSLNIIYVGLLEEHYDEKDGYYIKIRTGSTYYSANNTPFLETETAKFLGLGGVNVENSAFLKLIENTTLKSLLKKKQYTYKENGILETYNGYFAFITEEDYERTVNNDYSFLTIEDLPISEYTTSDSSFKIFRQDEYGDEENFDSSPTIRAITTISDIDEYSGTGTMLDPYVLDEEEKTTDLDVAYAAMNLIENDYKETWYNHDAYEILGYFGYESNKAIDYGNIFKVGIIVNDKCYYNENNKHELILGDNSNCDFETNLMFNGFTQYVNNVQTDNPTIIIGSDDELTVKVNANIGEIDVSESLSTEWIFVDSGRNENSYTLVNGENIILDHTKNDIEFGRVTASGATTGKIILSNSNLKFDNQKIECYVTYNERRYYVGSFKIEYKEPEVELSFESGDVISKYVGDTINITGKIKYATMYQFGINGIDSFVIDTKDNLNPKIYNDIDINYTITKEDYNNAYGDIGEKYFYLKIVSNEYYSSLKIKLLETEIVNQPQSVEQSVNNIAKLSVEANGATSYQWQKKVNNEWVNLVDVENKISGSNTKDLSILITSEMPDETTYRCVIDGSKMLYSDEASIEVIISDGDWLYNEVLDSNDIPTGDYEVVKFIGDYDNSTYVDKEANYYDVDWIKDFLNTEDDYIRTYLKVLEDINITPRIFEEIAFDYFGLVRDVSTEDEVVSKVWQIYNNPSILNNIDFNKYTTGKIDAYKVTLPANYMEYDVVGANGLLFVDETNSYNYDDIIENYYDNGVEPVELKYKRISEVVVPEGYDYLGKPIEGLANKTFTQEEKENFSELVIKPNMILGGLNLLENISLPESLTKIGNFALYTAGTANLYRFFATGEPFELVIPKNVEKIYSYTFNFVGGASKITFEEGSVCNEFEDYSFGGYTYSIHVPASVERIGNNAVTPVNDESSTTGLSELIFENTIENPSKLKSIGKEAFLGSVMTTLTIPASVESIGEKAFASIDTVAGGHPIDGGPVRYLETLIFEDTPERPSQLTNLHSTAFKYNLPDNVVIPNGLTLSAN